MSQPFTPGQKVQWLRRPRNMDPYTVTVVLVRYVGTKSAVIYKLTDPYKEEHRVPLRVLYPLD